mmetsp:Transcript_22256/g.50962  ORF Transcript_22256/g.50962 Transcript_22256/m.50962 type:complete len:227 (-) Transcript_22256:447-1127(-)
MIRNVSLIFLSGLTAANAFSAGVQSGISTCRKFGVVTPASTRSSTRLFSEEVEVAAEGSESEFWDESKSDEAKPGDGEMIDLYIGNLDWDIDEDFLADEFSVYGEVSNVFLPRDRDTGRKRGFAFVTMVGREGAESAVTGLDGEQLYGRAVRVNEAQKREQKSRPRPSFEPVDASNFNTSGEYGHPSLRTRVLFPRPARSSFSRSHVPIYCFRSLTSQALRWKPEL